jgi:hypothetical protein
MRRLPFDWWMTGQNNPHLTGDPDMNNTSCQAPRTPTFDMNPIIEPLASFICAAEQPSLILKLALAALYSQIEQTNRAAKAHLESLLENRCSVSV